MRVEETSAGAQLPPLSLSLEPSSMSRSPRRSVACLMLALGCFMIPKGADAVVGMSDGVLSLSPHSLPVQTVQYGECWYANGPNGPGYYPCGIGGGGGFGVGPAFRRHHRHRAVVNPRPVNPAYLGAPARRLGAGSPSTGLRGVGAPAYRAGGIHTMPGLQRRVPMVSPGLAGVHGPSRATGATIARPASPGLTGGGGIHGPGGAPATHVGAPASPVVPVTPRIAAPTFPRPAGRSAPHIGAPSVPNLAGVHGPGGIAASHVGAPASPGRAGGGVHGPAGVGAFHGAAVGHR
jgi:hypothetical protein